MKMTARKSGGVSTTEVLDRLDTEEVNVTSVPPDLQSSSTSFLHNLLRIKDPSSSEALLPNFFLLRTFRRSLLLDSLSLSSPFSSSSSSTLAQVPFKRSCLELSKLTCLIVGGHSTRGGVGSCEKKIEQKNFRFHDSFKKFETSKEESVMMHLWDSAGLGPRPGLASELLRLSVLETACCWLRDFAKSSLRWTWWGLRIIR